jgi:hypothetical protein
MNSSGAQFILNNALEFVTSQGRMKYTRPLYREMYKSGWAREEVRGATQCGETEGKAPA